MKARTNADIGILKKLLAYLSGYKLLFLLSTISAAGGVIFALYVPVKLGDAIDLLIGAGQVDFVKLAALLTECGVFIAISAALQWLTGILNNRITYEIIRDIRRDAFAKLEILPLSYIDTHPYGDTVSRIITDVDQLADGLLLGFSQLFTGIVTIVTTLVFMVMLQPIIALIVVVLTPMSLLAAKYIAKHTYQMFLAQSKTRAEQTGFIDEMISELKTVKAFSHEEENMKKFDEINERLEEVSLKAVFYSSLTNPTTRLINAIVYAAVALAGAFFCITPGGIFTVGNLSALLYFANQYTKPFNEISSVITELQNAFACASRVFMLIDEAPEAPDAPDAAVLQTAEGRVELDNVAFSYVPERQLIKDLSLSTKPGQRVAIVGPTGSGKTTLINLLMRFYDVDEGSVKVDGHDIRTLTRKSLRANYGMVLQETWLKSGTIRDNIKMSKKDATENEVIAAAKASYAHNFIKRLPNGYDTVIGEDGGSLSQGQKQLLCISRIMLSLPPMLILDEATSSIDTRTELRIQDAFAKLMKGRTTFVVAHRLSTIREADVILVLKDGQIIEKGKHDELLNANGFYATLYNSQFAGTE
ncbi:MAG: ABC transporter ATP-binding protein [Eubacteriales bacterium]|nr:ABC transporter ATP-binding protein [Eubacteriales bacterium]MDD4475071.1 ABC transporter ATP-binding protein [Eubacteriales bacterium]